MIHGQPKAKTFLSMFAKSATLFIRVSRKWSIPVGELIASTSASVAAQFPSKFLTKAALIAAFVYSGASVADSCPGGSKATPAQQMARRSMCLTIM